MIELTVQLAPELPASLEPAWHSHLSLPCIVIVT